MRKLYSNIRMRGPFFASITTDYEVCLLFRKTNVSSNPFKIFCKIFPLTLLRHNFLRLSQKTLYLVFTVTPWMQSIYSNAHSDWRKFFGALVLHIFTAVAVHSWAVLGAGDITLSDADVRSWWQRFVSSTVNQDDILSHLQLIANMFSLFWPK